MELTCERRPIGRAAKSSLTVALIVGSLLLIPAGLVPGGTWVWKRGLVFAALCLVTVGAGNLTLAVWRPAHFQVRQQGVVARQGKKQPWIDAVGSVVLLGFGALWLIFIPLDVFSLHLAPPPDWRIALAGGAAAVLGLALTPLAVWENRFTTPNVQHQTDQTIVSSGVYRWVRHPIYLGNLLMTAGSSLCLGSYAGLWGSAVLLIFTIGRISIEERHLLAHVPGYADYALRVRARLIPFVI